MRTLEITRDVQFWWGIAWANGVLGRIVQAEGVLSEAHTHLREALETFIRIHAQFEAGRTHLDLAGLAQAQGNRDAVATHLSRAHSLFKALRVPKYVERTEQLAREFLGNTHLLGMV